MATNSTFNDGSLLYGSRTETVTPAGGGATAVFVFEQISLTRPVKIIEQMDETGGPLRAAGIPQFVTGTATVQAGTAATRTLRSGDYFTDTFDSGNSTGAETFIIEEVTQAFSQQDPVKLTIKFRKKYN